MAKSKVKPVRAWVMLTDKGRICGSLVCDDRDSAELMGENQIIRVEIRPAPKKRRKVKRK